MSEHTLGHEGSATEKGKREEHEPCKRHQLEFKDRDEDLDRENEEGEHDDDPGDKQDRDLCKIGKEADRPHQILGRIEQGRAGIEAGRSDHAGPHEIAKSKRAAARL